MKTTIITAEPIEANRLMPSIVAGGEKKFGVFFQKVSKSINEYEKYKFVGHRPLFERAVRLFGERGVSNSRRAHRTSQPFRPKLRRAVPSTFPKNREGANLKNTEKTTKVNIFQPHSADEC